MSETMTVKELIKELMEYGMDEPVFIGLGDNLRPDGKAEVMAVTEWSSNITCGFGVYLIPIEHLVEQER